MNTLVKTLPGVQFDAAPESRRLAVHDWFAVAVVRSFPPMLGLVLSVLAWQGIATTIPALPTPVMMWKAAVVLFADPSYRNGSNDQGVGQNVLASLTRAGAGLGTAAVIGIPTGFLIGRLVFLNVMASPITSLLWPVSPLAWPPIGLLLFKSVSPAVIRAIFICSIWLMVINTAMGVMRVPQDYLNVARVLNLFEWRVFTRVLFPAVLFYMLTGARLSIGMVRLVIVAVEMPTGGIGIGFRLWDEWNNLKIEHTVTVIFVIGMVGLLFEHALLAIARHFSCDAV